MADSGPPALPPPTAEQRRVAAAQYERANQVVRSGNFDYGISLLLTCCRLDPGNLIYRQALRQVEKVKHKNNQHGGRFSRLTTAGARLRLRRALAAGEHVRVLELAEDILQKNPWDAAVHTVMAEAFDALGLIDAAVWSAEQARQAQPKDLKLNRDLARMYEKRGNFTQAAALWELIHKADPKDVEAQRKAKDLAASDTIARGGYEAALAGTAEQEATAEQPAPPAAVDRVGREAEALRRKIEADPGVASHYLQLSLLYRRAGRLPEAREALEDGLAATANQFEIALELADLAIEPFRANLAVTEKRLAKAPEDAELSKHRQRLLKEINTRELDLFRQKAERFPTEMVHRVEIGARLLRSGRIDEAIRELQAARADPRQQWRAQMYLGFCFKARGNWRLAQRNFEEGLQALPPSEVATRKELLFQLALGLADAGELEKAVDMGYELANLDFGYRDIGKRLDDWQARLQELG
jgi:tetratricopeptide (TPR) repeat protein